ncbi:hypothetical protein [uncultured Vagococcus sp.]|uniref:hypothetical protein n=1 Tax=uncultured Vagococcus sp. TaxID=189676 RepID=UPI0028D4EB0B|nr:hypothetical protein [uncultured Vagococcus sp.]
MNLYQLTIKVPKQFHRAIINNIKGDIKEATDNGALIESNFDGNKNKLFVSLSAFYTEPRLTELVKHIESYYKGRLIYKNLINS